MAKAATKTRREPAETVKVWPLDEIVPYPGNPRTHPDSQIELLAKLMQDHGIDQPIVVDEHGVIIKGHGRLKAAKRAGFASFPVVIKRGLTEAQKRAERLADNQIALLAGWDQELIRLEIGELKLAGYDLPLLGFEDGQLAAFALPFQSGENDPNAEWNSMPEFFQPDASAFKSIVVHFKDQAAVDQFARTIGQKISEKTKFVWYPEIEIKPFMKVTTEPE
jgi:ParB/Sulfiredoxin domain